MELLVYTIAIAIIGFLAGLVVGRQK